MDFYETKKIKKTRKPHDCLFCNRIIPKGSSCVHNAGKYEGGFYSYYFCNRCTKMVDIQDVYLTENIKDGDFFNYVYDDRQSECPNCNSHFDDKDWSHDYMQCKYHCGDCDNVWIVDYSFGTTDNDY